MSPPLHSLVSGSAAPSRRRAWGGGLRRGIAGVCLGILLLGGCRDAPTDPLSGLVAAETGLAALALELPLPAPELDGSDGAPEVVERWLASWEAPLLEGRSLRAELYPELGDRMTAARSRDELLDELGLLGAGVRRAEELDAAAIPEFVWAGVERAREAHDRARTAVAGGDEPSGWAGLLRGADALREVGPEAVARGAVYRVEERLRRISDDASYSEQSRERIRHLVRGSRHALDDGAWGLAIRRAYYAQGLLDGNG